MFLKSPRFLDKLFFPFFTFLLAWNFQGPYVLAEQAKSTAETSSWYKSYDVLFTNPECPERKILGYFDRQRFIESEQVPTMDGQGIRTTTKKNAYCFAQDARTSGRKEDAPQKKLFTWINDPTTKEIFLSALTFSHRGLFHQLCDAGKRGVKIDLVINQRSSLGDELQEKCQAQAGHETAPETPQRNVNVHGRGFRNTLAHIKLVLVNPGGENYKLAFSSANLTTGLVLHHENWHFIELQPKTYIGEEHVCLQKALISEEASLGKKQFTNFMQTCRQQIPYPKEKEITTFITPVSGEGGKAYYAIKNAVDRAEKIWLAIHHFSHRGIMASLSEFKERKNPGPQQLRVVADDDLFWSHWAKQNRLRFVGHNTAMEYERTMSFLEENQIRYMETNNQESRLHHNKYIVFQMENGQGAVFAGAGNFTNAGFKSNFENFYMITVPHVVEKFVEQYEYMWDELSTRKEDLPLTFKLKVEKPEAVPHEGPDTSGRVR